MTLKGPIHDPVASQSLDWVRAALFACSSDAYVPCAVGSVTVWHAVWRVGGSVYRVGKCVCVCRARGVSMCSYVGSHFVRTFAAVKERHATLRHELL